jgi:tetratricopeptide (TPR) repeat protein
MAPEVWKGKASPYSDQYSLAATYAEMRLQRPLFTGRLWTEVMMAHLEHAPDLSGLGPCEQRALRKGLAKDAADRYPTCQLLVRELERALADDQGPAPLVPVPTATRTESASPPPALSLDESSTRSIPFAAPPIPTVVERSVDESGTLALADDFAAPGGLGLFDTVLPSDVAGHSARRTYTEATQAPALPDPPAWPPEPPVVAPAHQVRPWRLAGTVLACLALTGGALALGWYLARGGAAGGSEPLPDIAVDNPEDLNVLPPDAREADVFQRATAQYKNRDYQAAAESFAEAVRQFPGVALFHRNLGHCYHRLHSHARAIECYSEAIRLNPRFDNAYASRARVCAMLGEYEQAVADATSALNIVPDKPEYLTIRGSALRPLGRHKEALDDLTQAILKNPAYAMAYVHRGLVLYDQGDLEQAVADFGRAVELEGDYHFAYLCRGNAYRDRKEYAQAEADYATALKSGALAAQVHAERAEALRRQGKREDARRELGEALRLHPRLALAYTNRGLLYEAEGELDKALDDHSKALQLEPRNAQAYYNRYLVYLKKNLKEQADQDLKTARAINPYVRGG